MGHSKRDNSVPGIRRVFIDCTATCQRDVNTGIQRVVRNLVNEAARIGPELELECRGVAFNCERGFSAVDQLPSPSAKGSVLTQNGAALRQEFRARLKELLLATNLLDILRRVRQLLDRTKYLALFPIRRKLNRGICFGPGDVLLLPDESWNPNYPWDDVREAKACGAVVGLVLHDLIPIRFPEIVGKHANVVYSRWWDKVRPIADFIIGVSESVLDEIDAIDRAHRPPFAPGATGRRGFFHNGAGLEGNVCIDTVRDQFIAVFGEGLLRNTYLMVGMMSPRKNYDLALDAFDRLWANGSPVCLTIVGKYGWDCGDTAERIRHHPQFEKKLFWFEDVRDHELDYCYRHAAALVTTSYAEGFNLPIVEALSKACPVLASDLPVHREVGGAYAAFFPSGDAAALAELVARHQQQGMLEGVKSPADFRWPDWTESCRQLLGRVLELAPRAPASPPDHAEIKRAA